MLDLIQQGGFVMYPLIICSIISILLIVERTLFWINEKRFLTHDTIPSFLHIAGESNVHEALHKFKKNKNPSLCILRNAIKYPTPKESIKIEFDLYIKKIFSFSTGFETIISLSPLLGIFGTVIGIIQSFNFLGLNDKALEGVSSGLSEALLTTAAGLAVAMITLLFHQIFSSMAERHLQQVEKQLCHLEALIPSV